MRMAGALLSLLVIACGSGGGTTEPPQQQTGSVSGRVLSTGDVALENVAIRAERAGAATRNATTNATGNFQIGSLATGAWTVTATPPEGFEADGSLTANATVTANQTTQLATFRMRPIPQQPPTNFAAVSMVNTTFSPAAVTITAGGTVRWTNNDAGLQHNTTSSGNWASPNLNQNQTFEHTFPTAGTFSYSCTLHAGMNGTVTVVP